MMPDSVQSTWERLKSHYAEVCSYAKIRYQMS